MLAVNHVSTHTLHSSFKCYVLIASRNATSMAKASLFQLAYIALVLLAYISLLIIPCIIYHVTNKETLNPLNLELLAYTWLNLHVAKLVAMATQCL